MDFAWIVRKDYFLIKTCFNGCPENSIADKLSSSCKFAEAEPIFINAYIKSRYMNSYEKNVWLFIVGKNTRLLSCNPLCKKFRDRCSDYRFCEILETYHSTYCEIKNCKYWTHDGTHQDCLQYVEKFKISMANVLHAVFQIQSH